MTLTVWTVGHSTHPIEQFLQLLAEHEIELIADVRRFPGSRRLPQYGAEALARALADAGVAYQWLQDLGGRRRASADSPNTGWRHPAFRAYADHVETEAFAAGLHELLTLAHGVRTAMMCSEALWWRCHRRLIADVLTALGATVLHIGSAGAPVPHRIAEPARIVAGRLTYAE